MPFYPCRGGGNLKYIECIISAASGYPNNRNEASISLPSKLVTRVELLGVESQVDSSNVKIALTCYDGKVPYGGQWINKLDLVSKTVKRTELETNHVSIDVPDEAKTREWLRIIISDGDYEYGQSAKLRLHLK